MKKISISKIELEYLYFNKLFSLREISIHLGADLKTIIRVFKENKIPRRNLLGSWKIRQEKKLNRDLLLKICREYEYADASITALAIKYNLSRKLLSKYFKRENIQIKPKGCHILGKNKTEIHKLRISIGRKTMFANSSSLKARLRAYRLKQVLPTKDTSIERIIEFELARRELGHYKHYSMLGRCQADKAFPDEKIAIFCDGDYWHRREDVAKKDERINKLLNDNGWTVLRFWESEIRKDPRRIVDIVEEKITQFRGENYGCKAPKVE